MKYSLFTAFILLTLPTIALAGGSSGFVPLVGIPGLGNQPTFDSYIDALYALAISVAALIAVIQLVIGGAQYMMDDLITSKSAAKERIKNALIGLLIIIAAALILTTINSNLTNLDINAPVINVDNSTPELSLEDALLQGFCDSGNGCQAYTCDSAFMKSVLGDQNINCKQKCDAINGFYDKREVTTRPDAGPINTSVCALSNNQISEIVTDALQDNITKYCPPGKSCYAESCDNYGTEYRTYSCSGACTSGVLGSGLGGVYYDSLSKACIFVGPTDKDKIIDCKYDKCQIERNQCAADGGYVSKATASPRQIYCRIPEAISITCPAGESAQNVDVESCVDNWCFTNTEVKCVPN
jgi:hypothetical protein